MLLLKSHGLGNDYLIVQDDPPPPTPRQVVLLCDRNQGVGGDGILLPCPAEDADFGLRIFNPDGSEAEISGNGLRIYAHWLHHHRGAPASFTVQVGGRRPRCTVAGQQVQVDMGPASFAPQDVPVDWPEPLVEQPLPGAPLDHHGRPLRVTAVGLGNPHCVIFTEQDLDQLPWQRWGAALERHASFPNRSNVQLVRVLARDHLQLRIWERGAGPTLASGSSACAAAAAALLTGRCGQQIRGQAPGGDLQVDIDDDWQVQLTGPVQEVGSVQLSSSFSTLLRDAGA